MAAPPPPTQRSFLKPNQPTNHTNKLRIPVSNHLYILGRSPVLLP